MKFKGVEKKLREAKSSLDEMIAHEREAHSDSERFERKLSGFLSAARSVDSWLGCEHKATFPTWYAGWRAKLSPREDQLIDFMVENRNAEVHRGGSSLKVSTEKRGFGPGTHRPASGTMDIVGPPGVSPLAHMYVPAHSFTIDGAEVKATEACKEYLALQERMVAEFKADHAD
jgi:hypothetical protein